MKSIIKYIGALLGAMLLIPSCEDALDRFPLDKLSPETFLSTETEMRAYTNKFYPALLPSGFLNGPMNDLRVGRTLSDEIRGARNINSGSGSWSWGTLRDINTFIEYSGNCKNDNLREQYVGLARFFRAYFYFEKVKMFGDVPWYDHTLGSSDADLYKPRDSRELVMQKMIEDIDYAIAKLPTEHSDYRITKWTAMAFKSRFCLFEGTFRKYHAGDITLETLPADAMPYTYYLEQAADAADKFISSSGYSIYNAEGTDKSYAELFLKKNISDNINREVILGRDYNVDYSVVHSATGEYTSATLGRTGYTRKLIASYLMKDGSRFTDQAGWETMGFKEETQNRDPRLAQSIRTPGYKRPNTTALLAPNLEHCVTGYSPIKYFRGPEDDGYKQGDADMILFRAAEVFLNFAEAKAELGTLTQADLDRSIKPLRDRVGMPNLNLSTANADPDPYLLAAETGYPKVAQKNSSNVGVILEIRRERAIELIAEGFRYDDMIRWAEGHGFESHLYGMYFPGPGSYDLDGDDVADITLYTGSTAPTPATPQMYQIGTEVILSEGNSGYVDTHKNSRPGFTWNENRDYYYPIPKEQRALTQGALTQNPGWPDGYSPDSPDNETDNNN